LLNVTPAVPEIASTSQVINSTTAKKVLLVMLNVTPAVPEIASTSQEINSMTAKKVLLVMLLLLDVGVIF